MKEVSCATIGRANLNSIRLWTFTEILDLLLLLVPPLQRPADCSVVELHAECLHLELFDWTKELEERRDRSKRFLKSFADLLKFL